MSNTTNNTTNDVLVDTASGCAILRSMKKKNTSGTRRLNRHGTLISKGPGKPWLARWMVAGKMYYRTTGEVDRNKALKRLEEFTKSLREDDLIATIQALKNQLEMLQARRTKSELSLESIWEEFFRADLSLSDLKGGTVNGYRTNVVLMCEWMRRHGARDAEGITKNLAGEYLREIQPTISKSAWNCKLVLFKRVWKILSEAGFALQENAWEFEKQRGCKHESVRKALSPEELARIVDSARDDRDLHLVMVIGQYTGMRLSDAANLKWADVDFRARKISVVPVKTERHGTRVTIPMHPVLEAELLKARETSTGTYVSERNVLEYKSRTLDKKTSELFRKCGFETSTTDAQGRAKRQYGYHSLRHSMASNLANAGVPITVIREILGHTSSEMSLAYCHADEEKVREAMKSVAQEFKKRLSTRSGQSREGLPGFFSEVLTHARRGDKLMLIFHEKGAHMKLTKKTEERIKAAVEKFQKILVVAKARDLNESDTDGRRSVLTGSSGPETRGRFREESSSCLFRRAPRAGNPALRPSRKRPSRRGEGGGRAQPGGERWP